MANTVQPNHPPQRGRKGKGGEETTISSLPQNHCVTALTLDALQQLAEDNYQRDLVEFYRTQPRYSLRSAGPGTKSHLVDAESFTRACRDSQALQRYARTGGPDVADVRGIDPDHRRREPRKKEPLRVALTDNTPIERISAHTDPELIMASLAEQEILLQDIDPSDDISIQQLALHNYTEIMDTLTASRDMSDLSLDDCRKVVKRIRDFPREKPFCGIMPLLCGPPNSVAVELAKSKGWILLAPSGPLTIYDEEIFFSEASRVSAFGNTYARADHLLGSHPSLIHPSIMKDLGHLLTPALEQRKESPGAINLIIETKGIDGHMLKLAAQALVAGAMTARTMLELRQWNSNTGKQGIDARAYSLVLSINLESLTVYGCRPFLTTKQSPRIGYSVFELGSMNIRGHPDNIVDAARWIRNAVDLTTKWRLGIIAAANLRALTLDATHSSLRNRIKLPDVLYHNEWTEQDYLDWFEKSLPRQRKLKRKAAEKNSGPGTKPFYTAIETVTPRECDIPSDTASAADKDNADQQRSQIAFSTVPSTRRKQSAPEAQSDGYARPDFSRRGQIDERSDCTKLSQRTVLDAEINIPPTEPQVARKPARKQRKKAARKTGPPKATRRSARVKAKT